MANDNLEHVFPPLIGSPTGQFRVHIIGNSGSGKAWSLDGISTILGLPFISLDELYWKPSWVETPPHEFREIVQNTLDHGDTLGWVVEGSYRRILGNLVTEKATDVIWLDPPLALYFPRIVWRTILRLLTMGPPCSKGCDESIRMAFFSKDSIILWCLTHHSIVRERGTRMMEQYGLDVGRYHGQRKMRRIGGWGGQLSKWLENVRTMAVGKRSRFLL
ncbi:hypothetical protein AMATHDRAFT_76173 [Amanita thiersii Skay4041]|uniref:Adenylate kinase n=1 Tax=Amanita thiersii Skay4041 TaxID=703135 RepID=A0A2A9NHH9_9AGAR|nr:hypothetical protein AMATHDRAFT_76173 [Amanita thiersii Skay4041]